MLLMRLKIYTLSRSNKDIDNLNTQKLFGRSMNEAVTNIEKALDTKPRELSFADVKDDVFDLLGYDRATLDENLSKDQQSAIWLNVMKASNFCCRRRE